MRTFSSVCHPFSLYIKQHRFYFYDLKREIFRRKVIWNFNIVNETEWRVGWKWMRIRLFKDTSDFHAILFKALVSRVFQYITWTASKQRTENFSSSISISQLSNLINKYCREWEARETAYENIREDCFKRQVIDFRSNFPSFCFASI